MIGILILPLQSLLALNNPSFQEALKWGKQYLAPALKGCITYFTISVRGQTYLNPISQHGNCTILLFHQQPECTLEWVGCLIYFESILRAYSTNVLIYELSKWPFSISTLPWTFDIFVNTTCRILHKTLSRNNLIHKLLQTALY